MRLLLDGGLRLGDGRQRGDLCRSLTHEELVLRRKLDVAPALLQVPGLDHRLRLLVRYKRHRHVWATLWTPSDCLVCAVTFNAHGETPHGPARVRCVSVSTCGVLPLLRALSGWGAEHAEPAPQQRRLLLKGQHSPPPRSPCASLQERAATPAASLPAAAASASLVSFEQPMFGTS